MFRFKAVISLESILELYNNIHIIHAHFAKPPRTAIMQYGTDRWRSVSLLSTLTPLWML
jgi:hypothetical protein